ncbi:sodium/potassium/calcium exchanger 5-like [Diadema setosum]|uniref:sodium/potassium/calcium exchanger 5-like n=1 Tax=Diadema setosum TaxID=31175 RepID=UPI003B3AD0C8
MLHWWPFVRDCAIYVISILVMVIVLLDSKIVWWEGLILSSGYVFYIIIMYYNSHLSERADDLSAWWQARNARRGHDADTDGDEADGDESDSVSLLSKKTDETYGSIEEHADTPNGVLSNDGGVLESDALIENGSPRWKSSTTAPSRTGSVRSHSSSVRHPTLSEQSRNVFHPPKNLFFRTLWFVGLPAVALTFVTIPDCRKSGIWRQLYFFTFALSTCWLAGTAYILYWMIVIIGYTLNIPDTVMGISLLAAGTSVPDAIASVLVARDGYGDMALSNIIGSNIFEVFLCLGFLWFLYGVIFQEPVEIASNGLVFTTIALLLTVAFILLAIHLNGWKLDVKMGVICLMVYLLFITVAIVWELGLFGGIDLPNYCPGPS